jgi:transcriptional repressor NrdR
MLLTVVSRIFKIIKALNMMKCPFCLNDNSEVLETRQNDNISGVRRRRECSGCKKRFTTYERVEEIKAFVLKKDGNIEQFSEEKLKKGLMKAAQKTKISYGDIENIIQKITQTIYSKIDLSINSQEIGNLVAEELKKIDKVAYIRFASVFREFVDVADFKKELKRVS